MGGSWGVLGGELPRLASWLEGGKLRMQTLQYLFVYLIIVFVFVLLQVERIFGTKVRRVRVWVIIEVVLRKAAMVEVRNGFATSITMQ